MNTAVEFGDELIGGCASTVLSAIEFQFVTSFACAAVGSASASNTPTTASLSRVTFMPTSSGPRLVSNVTQPYDGPASASRAGRQQRATGAPCLVGQPEGCRPNAGLARYGPHALRNRRCSLWLAHGFEPVLVKQWSGHSKASMLHDV